MCPHPPQLKDLPSGVMSCAMVPVPLMITRPPRGPDAVYTLPAASQHQSQSVKVCSIALLEPLSLLFSHASTRLG